MSRAAAAFRSGFLIEFPVSLSLFDGTITPDGDGDFWGESCRMCCEGVGQTL